MSEKYLFTMSKKNSGWRDIMVSVTASVAACTDMWLIEPSSQYSYTTLLLAHQQTR